jgi:predicted transcriptional regulator
MQTETIKTILPVRLDRNEKKMKAFIDCLKDNPRISLTMVSRKTGIPVSTLHGYWKMLRDMYTFQLVRRENENELQIVGTVLAQDYF